MDLGEPQSWNYRSKTDSSNKDKLEGAHPKLREYVEFLIEHLGDDPFRPGFERTPARVAKAMEFMTSGYRQSIKSIINDAFFELSEDDSNEMVIVRNIEFYSLCEHHLLPFFGTCHVGYLPQRRIIGLSKLARIVDFFSKRFQVQERLTSQIAQCLMDELVPHGVGVIMEASHLCMMMRGVQKQNATAQTSSLLGSFRNAATRAEFISLIKHSS